jgi:DNA repair protein RadA/Sms
MARARSVYRCAECGHEHPKWAGRCEGCGAWNSVSEEPVAVRPAARGGSRAGGGAVRGGAASAAAPARLRDVAAEPLEWLRTGIAELDFVLAAASCPAP